jgi:hypothetical protein
VAATVQSDAPASATPVLLRDQLQLDSGRLSTQRRAAARRWSWLFHRSIEGHRSIPNCYVTLDPRSDQVGHDATVPAAVDERRYVHSSSLSRPCAACGTVGPTASPSSASKNTVAEIVKRHRADAGQRQMSFARDEPYHAGNGRGGCQDAIVRAQSRAFSLSVRNTGEKRVVATRWQLRVRHFSVSARRMAAAVVSSATNMARAWATAPAAKPGRKIHTSCPWRGSQRTQ